MLPPQVAYDTAYSIVTKRKWAIVDARPPQANREGIIQGGGAHADHGLSR